MASPSRLFGLHEGRNRHIEPRACQVRGPRGVPCALVLAGAELVYAQDQEGPDHGESSNILADPFQEYITHLYELEHAGRPIRYPYLSNFGDALYIKACTSCKACQGPLQY